MDQGDDAGSLLMRPRVALHLRDPLLEKRRRVKRRRFFMALENA
jgi:hypothetical protein